MSTVLNVGKEQIALLLREMNDEQKKEVLDSMLREIKRRQERVESLLIPQKEKIPLGIFSQDKLSCLESIVKYLKETKSMKFGTIAKLLGRDNRTIWATYTHAMKKMPEPLKGDGQAMPASLIANRVLSVLEHVVVFTKALGYTNHEIALMLHLDDRTIWSVLNRAKKKKGGA